MSFGDVIEQVMESAGTPQKLALAKSQINVAVRRISGSGNYPQALFETVHSGPFTDATNSFPLVERFQNVGYVRVIQPDQTQVVDNASDRLEAISPVDVVNSKRSFGYYVSGEALIARALVIPETILIGWYRYPAKLEAEDDTNWVLDRFEYLVVELAVTHLLTVIGDNTAADRLARFTSAYLQQEVRSAVTPYELGA